MYEHYGLGQLVADYIARYTLEHDGGTFLPNGHPLQNVRGYALSIDPVRQVVVPVEEFTGTTVTVYMLNNGHYMIEHNRTHDELKLLGTWVHDGKVYLDVSTIIMDRDEAVRRAREHNQLAIYDLAEGREIFVEEGVPHAGVSRT